MKSNITIGTRGSALALWQAEWIKSAIIRNHPSLSVNLEIIKTKGDKILDVPLAKVGGKGLFVKEIEEALLNGRIDLAVHSMKDMPAEIPDGLCIGAVPERETPNDVLISKHNLPLSELPDGARIGTSSLRRSSQLLNLRPDITIEPLRGNLGTRIKKLETGGLDAIVLAAAGVKRLNLEEKISEYIDLETLLPAVGQGALCIETRENDPDIHEIVSKLNHRITHQVITGERAFLNRLEGGCQVPMAAFGSIKGSELTITGMVAEIDGSKVIKQVITGPITDAEKIGTELAERLIDMGAGEILDKLTGN
ncbi:MAG: hydroxymethylbilane synthase [Desulfobacteraceae bacterium]|nr:hydroxymethylbilane synthase [Desulfobacteraceae bacterium]MBC2754950.1 hydroxymethylbilane synthase [Desulfobacteraceae bacterium]